MTATLAPLFSMTAFTPTVVPWEKKSTSLRSIPAF